MSVLWLSNRMHHLPGLLLDDGCQAGRHADRLADGLNADLSLADARLNFRIYGASLPRYQNLVRPPRPDEGP